MFFFFLVKKKNLFINIFLYFKRMQSSFPGYHGKKSITLCLFQYTYYVHICWPGIDLRYWRSVTNCTICLNKKNINFQKKIHVIGNYLHLHDIHYFDHVTMKKSSFSCWYPHTMDQKILLFLIQLYKLELLVFHPILQKIVILVV